MLEAKSDYNRSILDYLNEDCWRVVLNYVPILDIIRTERVSRRWQRAVLIYLRGIRFRIISVDEEYEEKKNNIESHSFIRSLILSWYGRGNKNYDSFAKWTNKLGASVVATYCKDLETLKIMKAHCPNLEALTLLHVYYLPESREEITPYTLKEDFKCLKKVCFNGSHASDEYVSQFMGDRALEELEFKSCYEITGQCLNIVNISKLKSLVFDICYNLKSQHIISAMSQLNELTKLVLNDVPSELCSDIQLVLNKLAKLEWLEINETTGCVYSHARTDQPSLLHVEPLCQLGNLKYLSIGIKVTDNVIETVTEGCKELTRLELSNCEDLSSQAVRAICQNAGVRLTTLGLHAFDSLTDDDVVLCISGCPKLTCLSISGTDELTPALLARAAAVRGTLHQQHRLHFIIRNTNLSFCRKEIQTDYENLILEID
ncbi:uncharacterized protein LOC125234075 [Leguminivora glycinivorella]|uniref:uncharacterized protein LOC125234075 n=1 Tax=Leguminivora glycinivorella TaxID=1035111 RepID=UPI00200F119C|nr:uncharacterized protein LOC125234075 [Leguminivora glycinivorella]XP_047996218.1 uncharacterized protein LOC125234075 [Leguminivora glycinivorella]